VSSWAVTVSPVVVVVAPIRLMIVSWLVRGLPRQLLVIWKNRRRSILFHLLVLGQVRPDSVVTAGERLRHGAHSTDHKPAEAEN